MKSLTYLFISVLLLVACNTKKKPLLGETEYQRSQNAFFKDATKSPLKNKDREHFEGLDFFKFDSSYVVNAIMVLTPEAEPFEMKTSTARVALYRKYARLEFTLKQRICICMFIRIWNLRMRAICFYLFLMKPMVKPLMEEAVI